MNDELYHHGIKGQKWGVRRYQNKDGSLTPSGKKRAKVNYSREIDSMSNDELRKKIKRMQQEDRYYELTKKKNRFPDGADTVKSVSDAASKANKLSKAAGMGGKYSNVTGQGLNIVSKSANAAKTIDENISNKKHVKTTRKKLETMSDSELNSRVERLDLEKQYRSLKSKDINRGKTKVKEIMSITGDVLAIGASAAALAVSIKKLK